MMGEEVKMTEYEERVAEWETGLPNADDLTPLSQPLIPPELASAFSISPEPYRTTLEVNRASQTTLSTLSKGLGFSTSDNFKSFAESPAGELMVVEEPDEIIDRDGSGSGSGNDPRKTRRIDCGELEADSALRAENASDDPSSTARTLKRPRLVWTPQLHKRFVDVVGHLGIKNAVPKTIMQLMNVEGLTRENVASHLQKYRLYLKRMHGLPGEVGPSGTASSTSDHQLFASTPVPQHETGAHMQIPMPYPPPMMQMPVLGVGHMGMPVGNHGFESHGAYGMMQQRDWSYHPHVGSNQE
ncbi:transcription factor PCL1-like [Corylus avellana]|uniref:transcription factor PCL1-like n=1 Tax=Corylus avellana TaxID=13451 RepID=UPI001E1FDB75|nr:transcription factor PCL1-like [Corylus avellana]XP_059430177.1 transcription factor PCL1-like [Corylus avellana]XP_059430178.1 transcription factor PCL1-like [Corylus avellana]